MRGTKNRIVFVDFQSECYVKISSTGIKSSPGGLMSLEVAFDAILNDPVQAATLKPGFNYPS